MSSIVRTEHYLEESALPGLFLQSWKKRDGGQRGLFFMTHGISEHSDCYDFLAQEMADQDWTVFSWDLRGHGRSEGLRGHIDHFDSFSKDLTSLLQMIKAENQIKATPLVLFAHSMGGLITTQTLLNSKDLTAQACILSSPLYGLSIKVAPAKETLAQWIHQVWPTFTMNNGLSFNHLSRDPKMVASYKTDSLRHRKISAPLFIGMKEGIQDIQGRIQDFPCPLLMQVAGKDTVVDTQSCLKFYEKISQVKKLHIYEHSFHEIYNDINRREVMDHLHDFLGELNL